MKPGPSLKRTNDKQPGLNTNLLAMTTMAQDGGGQQHPQDVAKSGISPRSLSLPQSLFFPFLTCTP